MILTAKIMTMILLSICVIVFGAILADDEVAPKWLPFLLAIASAGTLVMDALIFWGGK